MTLQLGINLSFDMETSSRLQLLKPLQVHAALIRNRPLKSHEVHADVT